MPTDFQTPPSILAMLAADQVPAHVEGLKAHLADRQHEEARYGKRASNTKVMNRIKRELAHFGAGV
jgi:hypothetical protein